MTNLTVQAWHGVLERYSFEEAKTALHAALREVPYNIRPAHIVEQIRSARARHTEIYGIHPPAPEGKRWAVDVIENDPELDLPQKATES
ncbi:hypothetical protein ACFJGV_15065 [Cnuibacter sp. UC19_7]|uniref:hypothetical protein n=1 Tax=Cnuibacter sp. UC19_7 TaxID=3350166 RepID=UPI00366BA712